MNPRTYPFSESFKEQVRFTARHLRLVEVTNSRMEKNGSMRFKDSETGVEYSLHESGYVRRYIWGFEMGIRAYQLNPVVKAKTPHGHNEYSRVMVGPDEQLNILIKAVPTFRGHDKHYKLPINRKTKSIILWQR